MVLEFAGNLAPQAIVALTQRHRLARLDSVTLQSTGTTFFRARIVDGRPVRVVLAGLRREVQLRAGQPNYLYAAAQQAGEQSRDIYAARRLDTDRDAGRGGCRRLTGARRRPGAVRADQLRLQEAHSLTKGSNILVAVIDSGVDAGHPELLGVIAGTFDALGKAEKPHAHGTAMAGTIAARSRLMGVAPAARILAIRAFGVSGKSAEATTFAIIKGIDHAMAQNARVINMSFAGPADPRLGASLATRARAALCWSPPRAISATSRRRNFPAADPNVIAVTATDAEDKLFTRSNRGGHIAVAAPGVDILVPAPKPTTT